MTMVTVLVAGGAGVDNEAVQMPLAEVFPPVSLATLKAAKLGELAKRRWQRETAGFVWTRPATGALYFIATDEASQAKLGNERRAAQDGLRRPGDLWKCGDFETGAGIAIALDDAEIIAISSAARNRTSDLFNHEGSLIAAIAAAPDEAALAAIDIDSDWP